MLSAWGYDQSNGVSLSTASLCSRLPSTLHPWNIENSGISDLCFSIVSDDVFLLKSDWSCAITSSVMMKYKEHKSQRENAYSTLCPACWMDTWILSIKSALKTLTVISIDSVSRWHGIEPEAYKNPSSTSNCVKPSLSIQKTHSFQIRKMVLPSDYEKYVGIHVATNRFT